MKENSKTYVPTVAVIGAGASGLAASIACMRTFKENGISAKVLLFESLSRCGKKILATGNGRCNLTNKFSETTPYGGDKDFAKTVISQFTPHDTIGFFSSLGLLCRTEEEGRIYPMSGQAASVLDALRFETERLGCEIITDTKITSIKKKGKKFLLNSEFCTDAVILSTGGKAAPKQGSDGSGYPLAQSLGHTVTKVYPALVPLTAKGDFFRSLKGIRAEGNISMTLDGRKLRQEKGEIQFTDFGISGIAVMQLSSAACVLTAKGKKPLIHIDFVPEISEKELFSFISETAKKDSAAENLLSGIVPKRLGQVIMKMSTSKPLTCSSKDLTKGEISKAVQNLKDFTVEITGTRGFDNAQVCTGGIKCSEFDSKTMMSLITENFFAAGEVLDVDGICGGFNLQWAWASGIIAGKSAAERIIKDDKN